MKLLKLFCGFLLLLFLTSCITTLPINKQFYNSKKVGIIIVVDSIGMARVGSQGLLDMAFTQGNKFKEPLKKVEPQLNIKGAIKNAITNTLDNKKKEYIFLSEDINYEKLQKFDRPKSDKKFSKKDFRFLKIPNNLDEVLYVKVKYGILVSYYGVIETDKQGYVNITTEIIDLSDNSLLQQEVFQNLANINGNWKKGVEYGNLKNAIQVAIESSITYLKSIF